MPETVVQNDKKPYRVVQVPGKITWRIEELWDGGVVRGPYGSREGAIRNEEKIGRENGFIDALVLQEVVGEEEISLVDAFKKDTAGTWRCVKACAFTIENREIVFTEGTTFTSGNPYMGVDVGKWLDEHTRQ